ncbi:alkaline phosphatase family protein [Halorarum halobium]|uniref:alkaline phosphatase family protein n=1 Tax=Halorarum halobium TaxID=3075121 RepID=UPI0028AB8D75|nr:alkaline phosphatase family protein [Halobaculum sp. XH14]
MTDGDVLAIAIDGACWPLVNQWIDDGELPNIARLREEGTWGNLESCVPPVTCPAWKCYSTGKNPGKLGVFWWENLDLHEQTSTIPTANDFTEPELWDLLNENGISTGVVGMPLTYPPKSLDGFMVAGGPGVPDTGFAQPRSVEDELREKFDYTPRPTYPSSVEEGSTEVFVEESIEQIDQDFTIAEYLFDAYEVDFLQICSFEINGPLQHLFYDGEPTRRAWQVIDKHVGSLADRFETVVIHSDHGTSEMDKQFYINSWLDQEGFLTRKQSHFERLASYGLTRDNIRGALERVGLRRPLSNIQFLRSLAQHIPDSTGQFGETEGKAIFDKIEWDSTKVVGLAQGPIYIHDTEMDAGTYEELRAELIRELETLEDDETGQHPIQSVFSREEIYSGPYLEDAPDLVALDTPRYHNKGGIGKQTLFGESEWRGNNARQGLYILNDGAECGTRIDAEIYDLAPTILELFDVSIPEEMDGEVLDVVD